MFEPENRILIVEEQAIVAFDIQSQLEALGYEVVGTASSGVDAVRLAESLRPDLVLMDVRLDGPMDGVEAARRIRQICNAPIVFLTAYSDAATLDRAKLVEPYGYLVKPWFL